MGWNGLKSLGFLELRAFSMRKGEFEIFQLDGINMTLSLSHYFHFAEFLVTLDYCRCCKRIDRKVHADCT